MSAPGHLATALATAASISWPTGGIPRHLDPGGNERSVGRRSADGAVTALGAAGQHTLVVDRRRPTAAAAVSMAGSLCTWPYRRASHPDRAPCGCRV